MHSKTNLTTDMDDDIVNPRGIHALDVSIVFTTLATVIVLIRFYTRLWMVRQFGADDLAILNALVGKNKYHTARGNKC